MIYLDNFDEIYSSMIAGAIPSAEGSTASLMLVIQDVLGTDEVHVYSNFNPVMRRLFYFAAPSRAFHSVGKINLPLSVAIPGHVAHRGNGAYLISQGTMAAAAVYKEGELRLFVNTVEAVDEAVAETGLPVYDVREVEGEVLESVRARYRRTTEALTRRAISIHGLVALACGVGYVGLSLATGYFEQTYNDDIEQRQRSVERLASSISFVSPIHERLARLQAVSTVVVRSGGWIEEYDFSNNQESFRLMLPEWVTGDHYAQLGVEVTADMASDGMVAVVKAKKGGPANAKPPSGADPTKAAPEGGAGQSGSLVPQQGAPGVGGAAPPAAAGQVGKPVAPPGGAAPPKPPAAKEPPMPQQAPFGSAASRPPPGAHAHAGHSGR